jgi:excisionase family DNA binding protein
MREQNNEQTEIANEGAVSVAVAARYLGVRVGTLYAWIYREKIPAFRLHGRWKLSRSSLESTKGLKHGRSATSD